MRMIKASGWAVAIVVSLAAGQAQATLAFWDFENATSVGSVSTSNGLIQDASVTSAVASQTGGGPVENFGAAGLVLLTRPLSETSHHPFITFSTTDWVQVDDLTFQHFHNHNPGFSTNPNYDVQLQLNSGAGFADVGGLLNLSPGNNATTSTMGLGLLLAPGTHSLRWVPRNLNPGFGFPTNTSSEFFAINDLQLNGQSIPEPATAVMGLLAAMGFGLRRRRHVA